MFARNGVRLDSASKRSMSSVAPARPAIAWKTGTSWGFRDAWTAGVFGRHVLVVWVGNFDGTSTPALVGVDAKGFSPNVVVCLKEKWGQEYEEWSRRPELPIATGNRPR